MVDVFVVNTQTLRQTNSLNLSAQVTGVVWSKKTHMLAVSTGFLGRQVLFIFFPFFFFFIIIFFYLCFFCFK
jgi:hypothetical protein